MPTDTLDSSKKNAKFQSKKETHIFYLASSSSSPSYMRKVPSEFLLPLGIVNIVFSSIKGYALVPGKICISVEGYKNAVNYIRTKICWLSFFFV